MGGEGGIGRGRRDRGGEGGMGEGKEGYGRGRRDRGGEGRIGRRDRGRRREEREGGGGGGEGRRDGKGEREEGEEDGLGGKRLWRMKKEVGGEGTDLHITKPPPAAYLIDTPLCDPHLAQDDGVYQPRTLLGTQE